MPKPAPELFDLTGRVALVTGGSRGLGQEMTEALAESGASVMILARRDQWLTPALEDFRARGFSIEGMLCDVSQPEQVQNAVEKTLTAFQKIDILVNNAGVSWGAPAEDMTLEKWKMVIDINLTGAFLFAQAVARHMIERKAGGSIVNIASINAIQGGLPMLETNNAGYVASKGGLIALTRELAAKWGRHGIRVNGIAPGYFPTKMTERIWSRAEALSDRIPLGRPGAEGELKGATVFLASDASSYMTGQTIVIDGGTVLV
jgi:NAD(P)-dependent dehydrogenase (short-subunit alcohol dehydrogenase family)